MASGDTLHVFLPLHGEPFASQFPLLALRNNHPVLQFDATTDNSTNFTGVLSRAYAGGGITVVTFWSFTTATSGTLRVENSFERVQVSTLDIDTNSFASTQSAAGTAPGTSGHVIAVTCTFTAGGQLDSVVAGELFRLNVNRDADGTSGTDDAAGFAELLAVEMRET